MLLTAILTDADRLHVLADADRTFQMNEEAFLTFYETTSRPLWRYLARISGDSHLADDLLQETYYRFLRAKKRLETDDHRRHYLFRIATNLVRDRQRRPLRETELVAEPSDGTREAGSAPRTEEQTATRLDLTRAMAKLSPRERSLLWLAYVQGLSHEEIAGVVGVKAASLKVLLFRARRHLVSILESSQPSGERS